MFITIYGAFAGGVHSGHSRAAVLADRHVQLDDGGGAAAVPDNQQRQEPQQEAPEVLLPDRMA